MRWPVEPAFRFHQERLPWTKPQFQQTPRCDRWTILIDIAYWMLYLGRDLVQDCRQPWHKPLAILTPGRVLQGFPLLFSPIGSPTRPVKTRGTSPPWQTGRSRASPRRFKVAKHGKKSS
jgi:hypothetical protein